MQRNLFDLAEGQHERDLGVDRVVTNGKIFVQLAQEEAARICRMNGSVTSDHLRQWADREGIRPHHPNVWGAIFNTGPWIPVGWARSTKVTNHARVIRVWALKGVTHGNG